MNDLERALTSKWDRQIGEQEGIITQLEGLIAALGVIKDPGFTDTDECPNCATLIEVTIPGGEEQTDVECPICHSKLTAQHVQYITLGDA